MKQKYKIPIIERLAKNADKQMMLIGCPMTGLLRAEWVRARYGQCIPTNWSSIEIAQMLDQYSPLRFTVADARNLVSCEAVERGVEWLWFIDHDVVLPPLTTVILNEYMVQKKYPIVAGLYFTKGFPSEPLIYRGHGNGYYPHWKMGDIVECDGHGMGCTIIHASILKAMYDEAEQYVLQGKAVRRIFQTPSRIFHDPETGSYSITSGTEDLDFLDRLKKMKMYKKAGWPKFQEKKYPSIVDTNIFCRHIEMNGVQYPSRGEEFKFIPKKKGK